MINNRFIFFLHFRLKVVFQNSWAKAAQGFFMPILCLQNHTKSQSYSKILLKQSTQSIRLKQKQSSECMKAMKGDTSSGVTKYKKKKIKKMGNTNPWKMGSDPDAAQDTYLPQIKHRLRNAPLEWLWMRKRQNQTSQISPTSSEKMRQVGLVSFSASCINYIERFHQHSIWWEYKRYSRCRQSG